MGMHAMAFENLNSSCYILKISFGSRYRNYPPEQLVDLVARVLALVPPWTRVYRIQRDIPMPLVTSGVEKGNLRELALARMDDLGLKCRDVRTREAGIQDIHHKIKPEEVELVRRDYVANEGWETFLAYEDTHQVVKSNGRSLDDDLIYEYSVISLSIIMFLHMSDDSCGYWQDCDQRVLHLRTLMLIYNLEF